MLKDFLIAVLFGSFLGTPGIGVSQQVFCPQVPFNFLYAGGVEQTFIRVEHPQWDAVEFMNTASGGINLMISLLDGEQIHYIDEESLVQIRKQLDTSSKPRDYRYAPMEYRSKVKDDGTVEVVFSARTDQGKIDAHFFSSGSLEEANEVVDPLNHAMEVIPVLYMEATVLGDERTRVLVGGNPLKIRISSFARGANFGIIFRTDRRDEKLLEFIPGEDELTGAQWFYKLGGNEVSYSIEKEKNSEGYYEVKRLYGFVQKAWVRPAENGREVKRISTYSLVHDQKEFVIEFDPPLFFPTSLHGEKTLGTRSDFRAKISNSGWAVRGNVKMESRKKTGRIHTEIDFLPSSPEFLTKRPVHYEVIEGVNHYKVVATEGR